MNVLTRISTWWNSRQRVDDSAWDGDTPAWVTSLLVHLGIVAGLTLISATFVEPVDVLTLITSPTQPEDPLVTSDEFSYSPVAQETIGAAGSGDPDAIMGAAPNLAMTPVAPSNSAALSVDDPLLGSQRIDIQEELELARATHFSETLQLKGAAGVGVRGATGAVDRITAEILRHLEEKRTLVVWLFDQSGSLATQRGEIVERLDRIYEQLRVIESSGGAAFKNHDGKPLLSSVVAFGESVSFVVPKPTADVAEIKSAIAKIKTDNSGIEKTFEAIVEAARRFKAYRTANPPRTVMFVMFTDEAGNDGERVDDAVAICSTAGIPVYCVGAPAPFGRREVAIKYVDPDPKADKTPQPVEIDQGPESMRLELVRMGREEAMDSGFGPYCLERLCYMTGGIYFAVHPNRNEDRHVNRRETADNVAMLSRFFDYNVMRNYRPDYVSRKEYERQLHDNKACAALVQASQMSVVSRLERLELTFPKLNEAELTRRLAAAQQGAAVLTPKLRDLYDVLRTGEKDRERLTKPRWEAGFDLSLGRVLAVMVRTDGYNAMLGKARLGMAFNDPKNDTWQLVPADEISVSSTLEKQAEQARFYLQRVVREHADTPWAVLAAEELKEPLGWKWREMHTGVADPPKVAAMGNGNPRPPRDDKAKSIPRPKPRAVPKL